ncbi:hypothetical protein CFter6_4035 [Collimonas fungivorans]|uniref:Uncharacterized protein n=1 Tax=Collimonas fungivorans TaxID=158899 RepID=A0A127PG86_9BURK|nr:hypothetical protein CFter6_4035 [Collimonas fungivorans]
MKIATKPCDPASMRSQASCGAAAFYRLDMGEMRRFEPESTAFW